MSRGQLGAFEEIVLLTVAVLHGEAYGVSIRKDIENRLERKVSIGAMQTALRRMEQKGFLTSAFCETSTVTYEADRYNFLTLFKTFVFCLAFQRS